MFFPVYHLAPTVKRKKTSVNFTSDLSVLNGTKIHFNENLKNINSDTRRTRSSSCAVSHASGNNSRKTLGTMLLELAALLERQRGEIIDSREVLRAIVKAKEEKWNNEFQNLFANATTSHLHGYRSRSTDVNCFQLSPRQDFTRVCAVRKAYITVSLKDVLDLVTYTLFLQPIFFERSFISRLALVRPKKEVRKGTTKKEERQLQPLVNKANDRPQVDLCALGDFLASQRLEMEKALFSDVHQLQKTIERELNDLEITNLRNEMHIKEHLLPMILEAERKKVENEVAILEEVKKKLEAERDRLVSARLAKEGQKTLRKRVKHWITNRFLRHANSTSSN